jgi:hypothetical protein
MAELMQRVKKLAGKMVLEPCIALQNMAYLNLTKNLFF